MTKTLEIYRNNKGIVLNKKYHLGFDGNIKFHNGTNKDIFFMHVLGFHFFYLKN